MYLQLKFIDPELTLVTLAPGIGTATFGHSHHVVCPNPYLHNLLRQRHLPRYANFGQLGRMGGLPQSGEKIAAPAVDCPLA